MLVNMFYFSVWDSSSMVAVITDFMLMCVCQWKVTMDWNAGKSAQQECCREDPLHVRRNYLPHYSQHHKIVRTSATQVITALQKLLWQGTNAICKCVLIYCVPYLFPVLVEFFYIEILQWDFFTLIHEEPYTCSKRIIAAHFFQEIYQTFLTLSVSLTNRYVSACVSEQN